MILSPPSPDIDSAVVSGGGGGSIQSNSAADTIILWECDAPTSEFAIPK